MITTKIEYLLFVLINLSLREDDEFISSKVIAEEENIPPKYIPQLMAMLTKKGWVESVRGVNGGVRLQVDPQSVTVKDVIDLAEDSFVIKKCLAEGCQFNRDEDCRLLPLWQKAQSKIDELMGSVSLADLANSRFDVSYDEDRN